MRYLLVLCAFVVFAANGVQATTEITEAEAAALESAKQAADEAATSEALAILHRMSDYLSGQRQLSFRAHDSHDTLQKNGMMLEFGAIRDITVRRPDRMRVEVVTREGERTVIQFDGKTFATRFESEDAYITVDRPGTLDQIIDYVDDELGAPIPLADLIHTAFYADAVEEIRTGVVVGENEIDGKPCDHVAFLAEHVGYQLWIEKGARPVPRRMVIEYFEGEGSPKYTARLSTWQFGNKAPDSKFVFKAPEGAEKLVIRTRSAQAGEKGGK